VHSISPEGRKIIFAQKHFNTLSDGSTLANRPIFRTALVAALLVRTRQSSLFGMEASVLAAIFRPL
jgi:hypothetical protein